MTLQSSDMPTPDTCLSPATCYHVYHLHSGKIVPAAGTVHGVCGKCFRFESTNTSDLRRLWDFTMREVVFMGTREQVWQHREVGLERTAALLTEHRLASEIRTASDPFFVAPDAMAKTYFQLSSETKYEIAALLARRPAPRDRIAELSHRFFWPGVRRAGRRRRIHAQRLHRLRSRTLRVRVSQATRNRSGPLARTSSAGRGVLAH